MALPRHRAVAAFRQDMGFERKDIGFEREDVGFEREEFGFERDHSVIRLIIDTPVTEEHLFQANGSENIMSGWIFWMNGLRSFDRFTHYRSTKSHRGHKTTRFIVNIV